LDEEFVNLIYEEDQAETYEDVIEEIEAVEEYIEEHYNQEEILDIPYPKDNYGQEEVNDEEPVSIESLETPQEEFSTKKVRIGGYFGTEVTIKTKPSQNDINTHITNTVLNESEDTTQTQERISITSLRPPKKKTIKLCKICGSTLRNTHTCPKCGAKLD